MGWNVLNISKFKTFWISSGTNIQHLQNSTEMNSAFTGEIKSQMPSWTKTAVAALFEFRKAGSFQCKMKCME